MTNQEQYGSKSLAIKLSRILEEFYQKKLYFMFLRSSNIGYCMNIILVSSLNIIVDIKKKYQWPENIIGKWSKKKLKFLLKNVDLCLVSQTIKQK